MGYPATVFFRVTGQILPSAPFLHGLLQEAHIQIRSATGNPQQQTIGSVSTDLGIGGNLCAAIGQIIAQQTIRAVILAYFFPALTVYGVAHSIAYRHA